MEHVCVRKAESLEGWGVERWVAGEEEGVADGSVSASQVAH